jgi:hypothetical protein
MDYAKALLKTVSGNQARANVPKVGGRLDMPKETLSGIEDHYANSTGGEARVGHKSEDKPFSGYKTCTAMSGERIITASTVTSWEMGDGPQLPELVGQSRNNGMKIETAIVGAVYSGKEDIQPAQGGKRSFEPAAKLNPAISQGFPRAGQNFGFNKDAGMFVCPAGHMAVRRARQGKKNQGTNQVIVYFSNIDKCRTCGRRQGCHREGAKTKTYPAGIKPDKHKHQMDFQQTDEFKAKP